MHETVRSATENHIEILESVARNFAITCKKRAAGHSGSAYFYESAGLIIGIASAVMGATASIAAVSKPESLGLQNTFKLQLAAGILAGLAALLTSLLTLLKPSDTAGKHLAASGGYEVLQAGSLNVLIELSRPDLNLPATTAAMEGLQLEMGKLKAASPVLSKPMLARAEREIDVRVKSERRHRHQIKGEPPGPSAIESIEASPPIEALAADEVGPDS